MNSCTALLWRVSLPHYPKNAHTLSQPIYFGEELYEVPEDDCEYEPDGSGFYYLASEDEDSEDFYEFVDEPEAE
jgi:hypothetical protein